MVAKAAAAVTKAAAVVAIREVELAVAEVVVDLVQEQSEFDCVGVAKGQ